MGRILDVYNQVKAGQFDGIDEQIILDSLLLAQRLSVADFPHNFQLADKWVVDYCYQMTAIQRAAKDMDRRDRDESGADQHPAPVV